MPERPALRVVDENGELHDDCPNCAGLETDVRAWRTRYANLRRDRNAEAREHQLFPEAKELHGYWKAKTSHPRSRFTTDRFLLAEPFIREYGMATCRQAIDGIAFDCFKTRRRNGTIQKHDSWELLFKSTGKFEEWVNRAPRAK